ncbi:unnamed protein product [Absidia cylindrospora]
MQSPSTNHVPSTLGEKRSFSDADDNVKVPSKFDFQFTPTIQPHQTSSMLTHILQLGAHFTQSSVSETTQSKTIELNSDGDFFTAFIFTTNYA